MTQNAPSPLKVTIIGAGIAGLFAARVLREKHNITLLERSSGANEIGAAVTPGPNATRWLHKYGWNPDDSGAISLKTVFTRDHNDAVIKNQDVSFIKKSFGSDWYVIHRIDLWTELLRMATAPSEELGIKGQPANFVWKADVRDVDVETGDVTLGDGKVVKSDLVIGADGIKSVVRPLVTGQTTQPRSSGSSMFRFVLPRAVVESVTAGTTMTDLVSKPELNIRVATDGSTRSIVSYPCRNYELLNVGCIAPDKLIDLPVADSWSAPGDRKDLLRVFGDFAVRPLLEQAENIKLWELRDHDPINTYTRGRTVLIGDAAHAMTPHQGQGASQAIEDGEGLSLFIDQEVTREGVSDVLRVFDKVRRMRASKIQAITRNVHGNKDPEAMWKNQQYNMTYAGIRAAMASLDAGEEF